MFLVYSGGAGSLIMLGHLQLPLRLDRRYRTKPGPCSSFQVLCDVGGPCSSFCRPKAVKNNRYCTKPDNNLHGPGVVRYRRSSNKGSHRGLRSIEEALCGSLGRFWRARSPDPRGPLLEVSREEGTTNTRWCLIFLFPAGLAFCLELRKSQVL